MTTKPKDRTAPTRKAQERQRKREAGLVPVEVWVHASRKPELLALLPGLLKPRPEAA